LHFFATADRLQKGWDVWLAEGEAKEVRLRIAPQAVRYIAEARWHPSQRIQQLADGSVELVFRLAPTYDLAHWIMSWGDACRVLEPPELAAMVAEAHRRAAAQYATPTP
jgi:predicted DNA-binding transcriptional regulator YafY